MQLTAQIQVRRTPADVWAFLGDPANVPAWDRGVGSVVNNPDTPPGVGLEFSTLGKENRRGITPEDAKMSYRITQADPVEGCRIQLTSTDGNARFFKNAEWIFKVRPDAGGCVVLCTARFSLRLPYLFLAPVLFLKRNAILTDLTFLKKALEQ